MGRPLRYLQVQQNLRLDLMPLLPANTWRWGDGQQLLLHLPVHQHLLMQLLHLLMLILGLWGWAGYCCTPSSGGSCCWSCCWCQAILGEGGMGSSYCCICRCSSCCPFS